jgi:hypothetical protein
VNGSVYDKTPYYGETSDPTLAEIAKWLREYVLMAEDALSPKLWRVCGYRFAKALAQGRRKGYDLTREFMEGMRIFSEEHVTLGAQPVYDVKRIEELEEKAEKLLRLAQHASTNPNERHVAEHGLRRLFTDGYLAIVGVERYEALIQEVTRLRDTISYLKQQHPNLLLWKMDGSVERNSVNDDTR